MLPAMSSPIVRLLLWMSLPGFCLAGDACARSLNAKIGRIETAVASLREVQVSLEWPAQAPQGELRLRAASVVAPDLGYRFADVSWRCPLQRDGRGGWRCEGQLRSGRAAPLRLALDLGVAFTDARLSRGAAVVALHRNAAAPDATRIDLTRVPLAWTQALAAQAWPEGRFKGGELDARLTVTAAEREPLRVAGPISLRGGAFDTPDGTTAAEHLGAELALDARFGDLTRFDLDGRLRGGELLFGNAYLSLQQREVALELTAQRQGAQGWQLPRLLWRDEGVLSAEGRAALTADAGLDALELDLRSENLAPMRDGYLTGFLGLAGLGQLQLRGAMQARLRVAGGELHAADASLQNAAIDDPQGRFRFDGLAGNLRYSADAPVASALSWSGGALYGLDFGAAHLPFTSGAGELRLQRAVSFPMLGGQVSFDGLRLRPPSGERGLDIRFGLGLDRLDIGRIAKAVDGPAFTGELSGRIPQAHYANDRLDFDGGLTMQLFGGSVSVSSLAMERPFGVAPTLSADIALDDLDLESLTGVLGFGSITGKLDGRIDALRLVDWQPVAFDAYLATERKRGVRQRISQRAVQDLSSVGDASFVGSLQGMLIGFFDDFGYARLGISCRLADEVCHMDGLGPASKDSGNKAFIIVQGAGLPRLDVVGINRRVDWPTLLERLEAVGKGDVKPVVQ